MKFSTWLSMFEGKYNQYLDELGEMGQSTAQMIFGTAPAEDGNTDVTVTREYDGAGDFRIVASGHDAAFLEFGSGVETLVTRPTVQADFEIAPGSWSEANDGPFYKNGYWFYNGYKYLGTTPLGAMQEACTAMEQWSETIARRVF